MPDEQQEQLIAQGLRAGKAEAWQTLYDVYAERVWRSVARLLGPHCADVADVVQETILAAARSAARFDAARGSIWVWLSGIARNQALLHLRKQSQRRRLLKANEGSREVVRWIEGKDQSPHVVLATAEVAALVRATLGELPNEYAPLLAARYLDGESVAQIALRENSSEVAVRSRLARARQAFRDQYGPP